MLTSLPPRLDGWPVALLSAAKLAGTVVACGPGVRPVAWPESVGTRCVALAPLLTRHSAAALDTAAWVWGAMRSPGAVLTLLSFASRNTQGLRLSPRLATPYRLRVFQLSQGDLAKIGPYQVTTPLRTVFDLLRDRDPLSLERQVACRLLLRGEPQGLRAVLARSEQRAPPEHSRVRRRMAALFES